MKETVYKLFFEDKKEVKIIAETLGFTPRYIRKILADNFYELYLEEKALRQRKRAEVRKIKERERKSRYKVFNDDNEFYYL